MSAQPTKAQIITSFLMVKNIKNHVKNTLFLAKKDFEGDHSDKDITLASLSATGLVYLEMAILLGLSGDHLTDLTKNLTAIAELEVENID